MEFEENSAIIKKELQNRANIVFDWIETNNSKINTIQDIATKSSNNKSVRVSIISQDGTVIGDSHKNPDLMDNHQGRKEIIQEQNLIEKIKLILTRPLKH